MKSRCTTESPSSKKTGKRSSASARDLCLRFFSAHTLARAQCFHLLRDFYKQLNIPPQVHEEVVLAGGGLPGAQEVRGADWIHVEMHPPPEASVVTACTGLGMGERS